MKFLTEKYRGLSVWLSLLIIVLGFVIGSRDSSAPFCVAAAFFAGALLYGAGGVREWVRGRWISSLIHGLLAALILAVMVWYLLKMGGVL